jgi:hypothetical protein
MTANLLFCASETGLLQGVKHILVVKVAGHVKALGTLGGGVAGDARHALEGFIQILDAMTAAEMQVFNGHGLHFLVFGTGVRIDFYAGIAALAKETSGDEGIRAFLQGGGIISGQGDGTGILIRNGGEAGDGGSGFADDLDARGAADVNARKGDGGGAGGKTESHDQSETKDQIFHKPKMFCDLIDLN